MANSTWDGAHPARLTESCHRDALSGALVVRALEPWFESVGKRLVK